MIHYTGHKANGDNISTTSALHPRLRQRQSQHEHALSIAATQLLKAGKVLSDDQRDNQNKNLN